MSVTQFELVSHWRIAAPLQRVWPEIVDVDAWHAYIREVGPAGLREPRSSAELKIRAFVFNDPEGYQIEIQSALA